MSPTFRKFVLAYDWDWVQTRLDLVYSTNMKGIIAEDENGVRVAAAMFDGWHDNSVCVHQVIENPLILRHGFYEQVAEYVFVTCDRGIMYGLIPSSNKKALKLDANIGFVEKTRLKDAIRPGEDMVIMELRKENCRFLRPELREAS